MDNVIIAYINEHQLNVHVNYVNEVDDFHVEEYSDTDDGYVTGENNTEDIL